MYKVEFRDECERQSSFSVKTKVLNSVSVAISDWISKRNISCFGLFRCIISECTGYIYI